MLTNRGFTLLEFLLTISIVAMVFLMGLPMYNGSVDRAKGRQARQVLKALYAGERNYRLESSTRSYLPITENDDESVWNQIQMENPNQVYSDEGFRYSVTVSPLQGIARRVRDNARYVIDESGTITGDAALPAVTF